MILNDALHEWLTSYPGFLGTFTSDEPDISKEKMKLSNSGAKFDFSDCWRGTFFIDAS